MRTAMLYTHAWCRSTNFSSATRLPCCASATSSESGGSASATSANGLNIPFLRCGVELPTLYRPMICPNRPAVRRFGINFFPTPVRHPALAKPVEVTEARNATGREVVAVYARGPDYGRHGRGNPFDGGESRTVTYVSV